MVEHPIGIGGSGTVHRAWDRARRCYVALKRPRPGAVGGDWQTEQLLREIAPASAVDHPCLARLLDWGVFGTEPYLAYEFAAGGSLAARLLAGHLTLRELLWSAVGIADGLGALHRRGWVHADVTPTNILFHQSGRPCLTDFGLARPAGAYPRPGARVFATASYAPLELLAGKPLSPAADTYALCAVLFRALTGKPPCREEAEVDLQRLDPRIGSHLGPVLLRGLSRAPVRRYADGSALRDALREAVAGGLS